MRRRKRIHGAERGISPANPVVVGNEVGLVEQLQLPQHLVDVVGLDGLLDQRGLILPQRLRRQAFDPVLDLGVFLPHQLLRHLVGVRDHAREIGDYFADALKSLSDLPCVADTRSVGLVGCVQCMLDTSRIESTDEDKAFTRRIDERCFELGLIVRPLGDLCVISPPLVITREQIDDIVAIMRQAISEVWAAHSLGGGEEVAVV